MGSLLDCKDSPNYYVALAGKTQSTSKEGYNRH